MDERDDLPTPPRAHLSLDELADLDAGLLSPAEAAAAHAHLADCNACAAELSALAEVGALLAATDDVPMPADVALRIDAALADEARERASAGSGSTTSAPDSSAAESRGAAAAAAAARTPTGSASPAIGDLYAVRARRERSTRIRRGAAALVGVAAVLGGGYLFGDALISPVDLSRSGDESMDSAAEGATSADSGGAEAPVAAGSGNAYTSASLSEDVARLLEQPGAPMAPVPTSARELHGADAASQTSRCVDAVAARADSPTSPLAVDVGTFDGVPAVIVVLSVPPTSDDSAEVWVVSDTCLLPGSIGLDVLDRLTLADLPAAE